MLKEGAKCTKISKEYLFQSCINLEIEAPPPSPQLQPLHVKHDGQPRSVSNARGVPLK